MSGSGGWVCRTHKSSECRICREFFPAETLKSERNTRYLIALWLGIQAGVISYYVIEWIR